MDKLIGEGLYGKVYLNGDVCTKLFKSKASIESEIVLGIISKLNLKKFYKIYELLFSKDDFIGYTMKYYSNDIDNIITYDKEYLIESFYNLRDDSVLLQRKSIGLYDLHSKNIIKNKNGLIIIDCDDYLYFDNNHIYEKDNDSKLIEFLADYLSLEYCRLYKRIDFNYRNIYKLLVNLLENGIENGLRNDDNILEYITKNEGKRLIY